MKQAIALVAVLTLSGVLLGAPENVRPVVPNGTSLQDELDNVTVGGPGIDVINDQKRTSVWTHTASGGSIATMIVEVAGFRDTNRFGIYSAADPTNKAEVFSGLDGGGDSAIIQFMANGDIRVNFNTIATGFGNNFGFYLDVYDAQNQGGFLGGGDGDSTTLDYTVYSQDFLNPDGEAQMLAFQGDDETQLQLPGFGPGTFSDNEWIIAFEDLLIGPGHSDSDYSDMVVMIESIEAVPEPTTLLLLGLGTAGVGLARRRSRKYA